MLFARARLTARAYVACVTVAGFGVLAGALARAVSIPLDLLALFAAAVVVAELFQVSGDDESLDPVDAQTFSFSSGVHIAAILVAGPAAAAIAVSSGVTVLPLFVTGLQTEVATAAAEAGLGVAIASAALTNPWLVLALAPLAIAVYQAHARLIQLRRETLRALETFANVVDERDPYTFRHSERVAEYVRALGDA